MGFSIALDPHHHRKLSATAWQQGRRLAGSSFPDPLSFPLSPPSYRLLDIFQLSEQGRMSFLFLRW